MRILLTLLCSAFGLQADLNNDGIVAFEDFAILSAEWLQEDYDMTLKWVDDSAMAAKFHAPRAVFNGWLFGGEREEMNSATHGLSAWNGQYHRHGAAGASGSYINQLWGVEGVGLFALDVDQNAPLGIALRKSKTGFSAFVPVLGDGATETGLRQAGSQGLPHSLIDCGYHTFDYSPDAHGSVERRVLLYCEYVGNTDYTDAGTIWFSVEPDATAGDNGTWHDLFPGMTILNIRHFHGGRYIQGKGLYIFTGDSNVGSSILFCPESEIADLINASVTSATTYFDRWCLGAGDRDAWGEDEYSDDHILTGNTQHARTVELLTPDSKYGYFLPDTSPAGVIRKVDFYDDATNACGTITNIKEDIGNIGWVGVVAKNGLVYFSTRTRYSTDGWSTGNSGNVEIWCIDPATDECQIVKRIPVTLTQPAQMTEYGPHMGVLEYGGTIMGVLKYWSFGSFAGDVPIQTESFYGYCQRQQKPATNLLANGRFQSGDATGISFSTSFNKISVNTGTNKIAVGNVVTGADSGASATVREVDVSAGAWATGDAVAVIKFTQSTIRGVFEPGEIVMVGETECATIAGIATAEVIADPTGQLGGNVLRVVVKNTDLTDTNNLVFTITTTAAQRELLAHQPLTFACRMWIDQTSSNTTTLDPWIYASVAPGGYANLRIGAQPFVEDKWHWISSSPIAGDDSITGLRFYPDGYNQDDDDYVLMYVTDFQLLPSAIANHEIKQLPANPGMFSDTQSTMFGE